MFLSIPKHNAYLQRSIPIIWCTCIQPYIYLYNISIAVMPSSQQNIICANFISEHLPSMENRGGCIKMLGLMGYTVYLPMVCVKLMTITKLSVSSTHQKTLRLTFRFSPASMLSLHLLQRMDLHLLLCSSYWHKRMSHLCYLYD